ncbi:D-alanyl-D-alanine carboxypeptidase/D-alanyl-D-alanine endopeptidase [Catenuloplanes atrovinosus]
MPRATQAGPAGSAAVGVAGAASPRPAPVNAAGAAPAAGGDAGARGSAVVSPAASVGGRATVGGGGAPGGPSGVSVVPADGLEKDGGAGAAGAAGGGAEAAPWRSRKVLIGAGAAVLALVVLGVAVLAGRPEPAEEPVAAPSAARSTEPAPRPVLVANTDQAPMPTAAGVAAAIAPLVTRGDLGPGLHVSVVDVATGTELYGYEQTEPATPASTTKLVTAAAALAARGAGYRIPTRVVAGSAPGEVVLIGGGDPTLAIGETAAYDGAARLDTLAEQVKRALGGAPVSRVTVDSSLFTGPLTAPGWDSDAVSSGYGAPITALMTDGARVNPKATGGARRHAAPDLAAGKAFAALLGTNVTVGRGASPKPGTPAPAASSAPAAAGPVPGTELGRVESPIMLRLVEVMLTESDNVVAEALARQVAIAVGRPASFEGGASATRELIAGYGLPVDGFGLTDGSGLSRDNGISPALLTSLVRLAGDGSHPELGALFSGLPVGGWSGTLDTRFRDPAPPESRGGAGSVRAKTGSLDGVTALAGVLTTADGRLLAFALLADEVPYRTVSPWQAEWKLDRIASELAACGC